MGAGSGQKPVSYGRPGFGQREAWGFSGRPVCTGAVPPHQSGTFHFDPLSAAPVRRDLWSSAGEVAGRGKTNRPQPGHGPQTVPPGPRAGGCARLSPAAASAGEKSLLCFFAKRRHIGQTHGRLFAPEWPGAFGTGSGGNLPSSEWASPFVGRGRGPASGGDHRRRRGGKRTLVSVSPRPQRCGAHHQSQTGGPATGHPGGDLFLCSVSPDAPGGFL